MDFLKRAADAILFPEDRADREKQLELHKQAEVEASLADMPVGSESADITTLKATKVDVIARAPVIDETIICEEKEVIQPVVHREIEKTEIRHVIQPVYQDETAPTKFIDRTLAPEFREQILAPPNVLEQLQEASSGESAELISTTAATRVSTVVNEPIIHETIKPHIIEEVRPVIHRTVHEPHIIRERKDIYEKIVEPPTEIVETREPIYEKEVNLPISNKVEYREAL